MPQYIPRPPLPSQWNGSFYLTGPSSPMDTALALYDYAPDFVQTAGGDIALAQSNGQDSGPDEIALENDARATVIPYMMNPTNSAAYQAALALVPWGGWLPCCNDQQVQKEMLTGSGFKDVQNALSLAGYDDEDIADVICRITADDFSVFDLPSGIESNYILAVILNVPACVRLFDPVWFMDFFDNTNGTLTNQIPITGVTPTTGSLNDYIAAQGTDLDWADHVGGEHVTVTCPFPSVNWPAAQEYIVMCMSAWFDSDNAGILGELPVQFPSKFNSVDAYSAELSAWLKANVPGGFQYGMHDMISPTPFTISQKKYLSGSTMYNPVQLHPPTYAECYVMTMLGGLNPLVSGTDPNAVVAKSSDGTPSAIGNNSLFGPAVLKLWSQSILAYYGAQPAGRSNSESSNLVPFASAYLSANPGS